jgi:hypothetical protein
MVAAVVPVPPLTAAVRPPELAVLAAVARVAQRHLPAGEMERQTLVAAVVAVATKPLAILVRAAPAS